MFHRALPFPSPVFLFLFSAALLLSAPATSAHPNGTSKVSVFLHADDSVTVEVDANSSDLFNTLGGTHGDALNADAYTDDDVRRYQALAANYMFTRSTVLADNRRFLNPDVLSWKRGGDGPDDDLVGDSAALWDSSHVFTFGGRLPAGTRTLTLRPALFPEFGTQTLCEASVWWRDTLVERRWLLLDGVLRVPVEPDTLEARLARVRAGDAPAGGEGLFARFTWLGFLHILPRGLDHILFVLGLFFFSTRLKPLLLQITAFTVAHSITLALTVLGVVSLPGRVVEPLIALSIAVVGIENVFFRTVRASRWLVVFAFGLIHGMGFAGVLGELGLPEGAFWTALVGFNLGVELGQLTVIAAALALTWKFRAAPWYFPRVVVPVSLGIAATGLYWAVTRALGL